MSEVYMERIFQSGAVFEKSFFRVGANARPRKGRSKDSTPRKQDANERDCVKRAARILNCNFGHGDILLSLKFDDKHLQMIKDKAEDANDLRREAEHAVDLFLRRLKRQYKSEHKTFTVVSDMDGETGEYVRPHAHIVITGEEFELTDKELYINGKKVKGIWKNGSVDWQPLKHQDDYTPMAEYLLRQVRRLPDAKKYKTSRNMAKPRLVSERLVYKSRPISVPKGAKIQYMSEYRPGEAQYVRYIPRRKENDGG